MIYTDPIMLFKINGKAPPSGLHLLKIDHFLPSDMMHKAEFHFENRDKRLNLTSLSTWLTSGNIINFSYGYIDELSDSFQFQIRGYKGNDVLVVVAYPYVKNGENHKERTFKQSKYSDVAKLMAQEMGLKTDKIQDTLCKESQISQKESNLKFLANSAEKLHFEFGIDGQYLIFRERNYKGSPSYIFTDRGNTIGQDIINFDPKLNTFQIPAGYKAVYIDPKTGKSEEIDATGDEVKRPLLGGQGGLSGLTSGSSGSGAGADVSKAVPLRAQKVNVVTLESSKVGEKNKIVSKTVPQKRRKKQELKCQTEALFQASEDAVLEASLTVIGAPKAKDKTLIQLNGVGKAYSGLWYVYDLRNTIDGSFISSFKLERNTTGYAKLSAANKGAGKPNAKLVPASGKRRPIKKIKHKKAKTTRKRKR